MKTSITNYKVQDQRSSAASLNQSGGNLTDSLESSYSRNVASHQQIVDSYYGSATAQLQSEEHYPFRTLIEKRTEKAYKGLSSRFEQKPTQMKVVQRDDYFTDRFGKPLEELTFRQILEVVDDTSADEQYRIQAESVFIKSQPRLARYRARQVAAVVALIDGDHFQEALHFIVSMADINLLGAQLGVVNAWTDVVEEHQVPRAGGLGLTLPGIKVGDPPRIYILKAVMKKWASKLELGNLINVIFHETIHVNQQNKTIGLNDIDLREFQAHASEIILMHSRILDKETEFYATGSQMLTAYNAALRHFDDIKQEYLTTAEYKKLQDQKALMEKRWKVVKTYTNQQESDSGLSAKKIGRAKAIRNEFKVIYEEAKPLEKPDATVKLTELKARAGVLHQELGHLRGDMNEDDLAMIDEIDDEIYNYSRYFNVNMKFMGL